MSLRQRKSLRLQGYDYSQNGMYFITICTSNRECLFGDVIDGQMILNEYGIIVENEILNIAKHYLHVLIDIFTIMPNHIHLIIVILETERGNSESMNKSPGNREQGNQERINPFPTVDIPNIIGKFKAGVSRNVGIALMRFANIHTTKKQSEKITLWQKSYHDHIIRDEKDYKRIYEYIQNNLMQWENDCNNPSNEKITGVKTNV